MADIIIYDCETIRAIPPDEPSERLPDVEYCHGWHDLEGMGISVVCAIELGSNWRPRIFTSAQKEEFAALVERSDVCAGFNSCRFDEPLLAVNWGIHIPGPKSYDLKHEICSALGWSSSARIPGYSLSACAMANLGRGKSGHGSLAPILWQRGQFGKVIDYCLNDVHLLACLLETMAQRDLSPSCGGNFIDPVTGSELLVELPALDLWQLA